MISNVSCQRFRKNLSELLNSCQLPPVVAYYIMKDSLSELQEICQQVIKYELQNDESEKRRLTIDENGNIKDEKVDQQES